MLYEIMRYCRNFFTAYSKSGKWEIVGGKIRLPFLLDEQYFLIKGSVFNDGVYKYPAEDLKDEKFNGTITALAIPKAFLDLVSKIEKWQEQYGEGSVSPFQSESFGGYSYSKASADDGGQVTWKNAFKKELREWVKK